uniref:BRWD/PHIP N-terminal domain-containing protein n=2 Tax=Lygus hesperus TaxID=30085 RepID=A0A0K8SSX6_LYGHE
MDKDITSVQRELYFLIAKFLKSGPCQEAAKALQNELEQHQIVQKRLDWEGDEHEQSFSDMERKYPHIGPNHLEEICCRLGPLLDKEIKPTVPGLKSLLGAGRQSLLRSKDSEKRFLGLVLFAARRNGISLYSPNTVTNHNVVQAIVARSISGLTSRRHLVTPKMYSRVRLLNRILGHLSAVYCLLFDKTGRYIVTGADDLLVKVWSAVDGRLLNSFRGTSAEITDIDISPDNTLLAAGSLDKSIRVWNLQSGYPVATLSSHTGAITGVNFWPNSVDGCSYMVSTSSDGSVAFWSYATVDGQRVFESKPIQYHEKLRPGQSQMLCARFSPGGMFLATGSADHHVRVYKMDREVPYRILEIEKHSDRVDSIQWANRGLKFVSGSKDGTAVLWQYQSQRWTIRHLLMSTTLDGTKGENEDNKTKLKVTMVCWSADDSYLITSVNDNTIKIWNPINGRLLNILKIHKDEVYVLENHPDNPRVMLSAGHDGAVHLWDIVTGEILSSYQNHIEGQGNGAVFDAKWSPDGSMIAATDAHGHILIFGMAPLSEKMKDVPRELFFHTDYRPIIRDGITDQVIDEQTQVPPHLMPPPFLVDIEGTPYPPTFQRLVPGRENCTNDQLIPNIVFTPGGSTRSCRRCCW